MLCGNSRRLVIMADHPAHECNTNLGRGIAYPMVFTRSITPSFRSLTYLDIIMQSNRNGHTNMILITLGEALGCQGPRVFFPSRHRPFDPAGTGAVQLCSVIAYPFPLRCVYIIPHCDPSPSSPPCSEAINSKHPTKRVWSLKSHRRGRSLRCSAFRVSHYHRHRGLLQPGTLSSVGATICSPVLSWPFATDG